MSDAADSAYVVWTYYGYDGWSPTGADSFDDAVSVRDSQMSMGNSRVIITKRVAYDVVEKD